MSALASRLARLETERTRRRRLHIAEALAAREGVSLEEAHEWTFVDSDDKAAALERFGRGLVDVGAVTRWLAERHGLTAEETAEAVAEAERVAALLEQRAVAERATRTQPQGGYR